MKKLLYILFFVLLGFSHGFAQNIDSLKLALKNAKHDTTRIKLRNDIGEAGLIYRISYWDSLANDSKKLLEKNEMSTARTKNKEKVFYLKYLSSSLNNLGVMYDNLGDIKKALDYYHKSLKIYEELKDKQGVAVTLNNIGFLYGNQGDLPKSLDYFQRSLKLNEEIKDENGIAQCLNNIGTTYHDTRQTKIALTYYFRSLKLYEEIKDERGIAFALNNIGTYYKDQNDMPNALNYFQRSLKVAEDINHKQGIAYSTNVIASTLLKNGRVKEAKKYALRSLDFAKEVGYPDNINRAAVTLKEIFKKQNNYKNAFDMYELEIIMRDSINNEATKKASIQKQFQYEYEKQAAADSIKNAEEQKVKNAQLTAQKAELKQEKTKSYALYGGLALVIIFAGFMVNRFRVTNKQKQVIELKEIETQKQNEIITHQKKVVEEKHKEITDSINYAERIQRSFLATTEMLDQHLKDYFVFFRPKDVVSGDFYWAGELNNGNFAFSIADSTGHGVPGAIMSILNISSLEKSIEKETAPDKILNKTRKIIIERLKKDGSTEGGKDGMDCSLLVLNQDRTQLSFAAANNPVFIVRNNDLIEFKPDKMPVGKHDNDTESFTLHTALLQKGDVIYALTDGFPDQFGGDKGKKYMIKNLKELLMKIAHLSVLEQEQKLAAEFDKWKGSNEQVDDVCIIGVRI